MAVQAQNLPLNFYHGCSDTHVLVQMSRPVDNFQLTPEQAERFLAAMNQALATLQERMGKKAN